MADPQGLAYFPGINQLVGCSLTMGHGITPDTAILTLAPQQNFEGVGGTLTLFMGNRQRQWSNCRVDRHSFQITSSGQIWRLSIIDRRWKWVFGTISGSYNLRNDDGTLKPETEKTPQDLARLLLDAMGETGYDVGKIPNDLRPMSEWDGDVPAEMLADLCEATGCRVVLRFSNKVSIELLGGGANLPTGGGIIEDSLTIDPPERPDTISVLCGHDRYQADFPLQAVAIDVDDKLVPINAAQYAPGNGWTFAELPYFPNVADANRERAKASVFRYYQILPPVTLPDVAAAVVSLEQILPIEAVQVDVTKKADALGNMVSTNKPAQVYGCYFGDGNSNSNNCQVSAISPTGFEAAGQEYKKPFYVDTDRGLVIFADFVYRNSLDNGAGKPASIQAAPATLYLRAAVSFRDAATRAFTRYSRDRNFGNRFKTKPRYLKHDEIVLTHVPTYNAAFAIQNVTTNQNDVDQQCDYYIDAADRDYQTTFPETIRYTGLRDDIELDGAIHQISIEINEEGTTTIACRNNEQDHRFPSFQEKRALERARDLRGMKAKDKPAVQRQALKVIKRS